MKYTLTNPSYCQHHVTILHEDFNQLKSAKEFLLEAMFIEEKFNLVLENYAEFELELLSNSVREMLFHDFDWSSRVNKLHSINRRIINLLTTCRLYIDQVRHNIHTIYGADSEQVKVLKNQLSHEYDSVFGYRVMEATRNYVQHRNLPIDCVNSNIRAIETGDKRLCKHTIKLSINVKSISEDHKFKASVLSELQKQGDLVEFTPLMRQYVESIGRVHLKIRELLQSDLEKWDNKVSQVITLYEESINDKTDFIYALALSDDSNIIGETVEVFDDFIKRRRMFETKNNHPYYSLHYVSSEAPEIKI